MLTLREIGVTGLRERLDAQALAELGPELFRVRPTAGRVVPGVGGAAPTIGPVVASAAANQPAAGNVARKVDAAQRLLIDSENHRELIVAEIYRVYGTEDGKAGVALYAGVTRNLLAKTVDRLAVVYNRPPIRTFSRAAAGTEDMATAWRETVLEEGMFNDLAEAWARSAFYLNLVHVMPMVIDGELVYETVLPHASDVVFDVGEPKPSILVYDSIGDGFTRVAVDSERYLYLDENWAVVTDRDHGYKDLRGRPMRPWVPWRVRAHTQGAQDYWQYPRGRQLVTATLRVGAIAAQMEYTRQKNNAKLMTLTARVKAAAPQQTLSPERPIELDEGKLDVHDFITPVDEFVKHMDASEESLAESYGVTRGVTDRSKSVDAHAEHIQLATLRTGMVKHVHRADVATSIMTAIIMKAENHPAAQRLDPQAVADSLSVKFQALTFVAKPKDRMEFYGSMLSFGAMDHYDIRMAENPDEDRATAIKNVTETVQNRNKVSNDLAKHQLSADATQDGESLDQRQGRIGGQATSDGDDDDERPDDTNDE